MILEQINIPFAPELASSVDISNQIVESNIGSWIGKNWKALLAFIAFIFFIIWVSGGFDKKPATKEEPKPRPITPPSHEPTAFTHIKTPKT